MISESMQMEDGGGVVGVLGVRPYPPSRLPSYHQVGG